jgi:cytochrome c oxidase cbb3-type subunit 3
MSDSDKSLVHHVYDGIEEQDNRLPNWWLAILWGTIFFGFGYYLYYHNFEAGPSERATYERALAEHTAKMGAGGTMSDEALLALAGDAKLTVEARAVFEQNCAACHGADGQGLIGPNLTDGYWLHGARPGEILKTISDGVMEKGMPAWKPVLGDARVKNLAAYVLSLKGRNVPGKEPQGQLVQDIVH